MNVDAAIPPQHVPNAVDENISTELTSDVEVNDDAAVAGVPVLGPEVSSDEDHVDADREELHLDTATDPVDPIADDNDIEADVAAVEETKEELVESARRYPLRDNRGSWKEYGLHISVKRAVQQFGSAATTESMISELKTLHERGTWEPVLWNSLSGAQKRSTIRSFIFLKDKYLADGTFEKLKSRLVGGGHMQDREVYGNVASPTGGTVSLFIISIIAVIEKRHVATADIASAYINADMDEEVLMRIDKDCTNVLCEVDSSYLPFVNNDGSLVVRLKKALYGCIQSALLWYRELSSFLISIGFDTNPYDECVFNKDFAGVGQCTIFVYVDDLFVTCKSQEIIVKVLDDIQHKYREVKRTYGTTHNYLGMTFNFLEDISSDWNGECDRRDYS